MSVKRTIKRKRPSCRRWKISRSMRKPFRFKLSSSRSQSLRRNHWFATNSQIPSRTNPLHCRVQPKAIDSLYPPARTAARWPPTWPATPCHAPFPVWRGTDQWKPIRLRLPLVRIPYAARDSRSVCWPGSSRNRSRP